MLKETINKLLFSGNEEDVTVGWELLKSPEINTQGEEWYKYFDIVRASNLDRSFVGNLIQSIVGENHTRSELWQNWNPKSINYENPKVENI